MASLISMGVIAQSYDQSELDLFRALRRQPNQLARYQYLVRTMPHLSASDQVVAGQFRSFSLDELGLYNQAVLSFPLTSERPLDLVLPNQDEWKGADAVDVITKLATDRRIVMINEAHHNAQTRELTLALLPRLRALGFTYFAAEALGDDDPSLTRRGYPVKTSGTEYLQEPLYGEIVREAIRLGFILVPYDSSILDPQARDAAQAESLYQKVFAKDPGARLFVHAGYAHIDKASGRLNNVEPMAMKLAKLTGLDPLSIDQTQFLESGPDTSDDYHVLMQRFPTQSAEVLINSVTGKPWSALPKLYDLNVILPIALDVKTFGDEKWSGGGRTIENVSDAGRLRLVSGMLIAPNEMQRPKWLTLNGQRYPFPISTEQCRKQSPCLISAHYIDESADATSADVYAFTEPNANSKLYLYPGRYRLRARNADGKSMSEQVIQINRP
ncbi:hypothetical protein [Rhodanobacter panaciterrae]|nr:hypothetical protein [Rhodanobacter panaciterrae]